jgi:murein L,D-transpeptidase YcbB/YkuD
MELALDAARSGLHVVVNAGIHGAVVENGSVVHETRVVVGRPTNRTRPSRAPSAT